jgi:hypothetical protein
VDASYAVHSKGCSSEVVVEDNIVDSLAAAKWEVDVAGRVSGVAAGRFEKEIAGYLEWERKRTSWVTHFQA